MTTVTIDSMHIDLLEQREADIVAREDASGGEFFLCEDGSVWYRNDLSPEALFVSDNERVFQEAASVLHQYNVDVASVHDEAGQARVARRFLDQLRALGALGGPPGSFWPSIAEQAEHGMI